METEAQPRRAVASLTDLPVGSVRLRMARTTRDPRRDGQGKLRGQIGPPYCTLKIFNCLCSLARRRNRTNTVWEARIGMALAARR